jgi:5-hydroxyisourate hydrolase-like protein (transthyretin family)
VLSRVLHYKIGKYYKELKKKKHYSAFLALTAVIMTSAMQQERYYVPMNLRSSTGLHSITTQKTVLFYTFSC